MKARIAKDLEGLAVDIGTIWEDPDNVRLHDEKNRRMISASLMRHGQQKPIVVREGSGRVVAGNGTLEAARRLGWDRIAASFVLMTDSEANAYAIADNRTAELATWDDPALASLVTRLAEEEGFEADALGFTDEEIQRLMQGFLFDLPSDSDGKLLDPDELEAKVQYVKCPHCGKEFAK